MINQRPAIAWEEIHGFGSPREYQRFVRYIEQQVDAGWVRELPVDLRYGKGLIYGGRWFQDVDTDAVWRLVSPDFPFRGLWEPVEPDTGG